MEKHIDRRHLSSHSYFLIREDSIHCTGLNKKRKLPCEHTDLGGSPVSKQKLENQQVTELAESSENSVNYPFNNHVPSTSDTSAERDWYCTFSSSSSNEATSSSTLSSSTEFNSGASTEFFDPGGMDYSCKKGLFTELEALHDPVITGLVKRSMVGCEDPDADTLDSMLYSNGFDAHISTSGGVMHDNGADSRLLTIDQEFEQYFSKLML